MGEKQWRERFPIQEKGREPLILFFAVNACSYVCGCNHVVIQASCFTEGRKCLVHQLWLWLHAFDPLQDGGWTVTSIISFFMREVLLEIVVPHPLYVSPIM